MNAAITCERIFKGDMDYLEAQVSKGKKFTAKDVIHTFLHNNHNLDLMRLVSGNMDESQISKYENMLPYIADIDVIELFHGTGNYQIPETSPVCFFCSLEMLEYIVESGMITLSDDHLHMGVKSGCGIERIMFVHSHLEDFPTNRRRLMREVICGGDTEVWDYFYGDLKMSFSDLIWIAISYRELCLNYGIFFNRRHYVQKFKDVIGRVCEDMDMSENEIDEIYSTLGK